MPEESTETASESETADPVDVGTANDFNQMLETAVAAKAKLNADNERISEWHREQTQANADAQTEMNRRVTATYEVAQDLKRTAQKRYNEALGLNDDDVPGVNYYDSYGHQINKFGQRI